MSRGEWKGEALRMLSVHSSYPVMLLSVHSSYPVMLLSVHSSYPVMLLNLQQLKILNFHILITGI